jgi:hypothetical protein
MSAILPSPLPSSDRRLLSLLERVVPSAEREDWSRSWQAELWHMRHRRSSHHNDLSIGLIRDALWLRTESWRRAFEGTAILCLAKLSGILLASLLIALALGGSWRSFGQFGDQFGGQFQRFLVEAPLIVFVSFGTSSRRHLGKNSASRKLSWIKRQLFFVAKTVLVLLFSFCLSADSCQPIHAAAWPNVADILQTFCFVVLAVVGLRWAFRDQELRCKQCLRSLATPARIGRPSHNLLEWNGTELLCKKGHGLLSVPEIETSWCQSSAWVHQQPFSYQ